MPGRRASARAAPPTKSSGSGPQSIISPSVITELVPPDEEFRKMPTMAVTLSRLTGPAGAALHSHSSSTCRDVAGPNGGPRD